MTIPPIPVENVCANQGELTCYLQAVIKLHVQVKRSHIAVKCGSRCVVRTMLDYLASHVVGHFFVQKKVSNNMSTIMKIMIFHLYHHFKLVSGYIICYPIPCSEMEYEQGITSVRTEYYVSNSYYYVHVIL